MINILLIYILSISIFGCSKYEINRANNGYKIFTLKKGMGKCSFEYNHQYRVMIVETTESYNGISLSGPEISPGIDMSSLQISCHKQNEGDQGYLNSLEDRLKWERNISMDFAILERFPVNISGESGEEVAYNYLWKRPNSPEAKSGDPQQIYSRIVMFVHNNNIWTVGIGSGVEYVETVKKDFEHIIQTFKLLD